MPRPAAPASPPRPSARGRVLRLRDGAWSRRDDRLAVEEPLEVRVAAAGGPPEPVTVTMRTPGADFALAVGLLVTEGLIAPDDVARVAYCTGPGVPQAFNAVTVHTRRPLRRPVSPRAHAMTAACGLCGRVTLDELAVRCAAVDDGATFDAAWLTALPDALRDTQPGFARTGTLHGAGLFTPGAPPLVAEDIGRHNAVDKVIGAAAMDGRLPLRGTVLTVSGRVSFEIVQKAAMAGIPVICAVSGPSTLAVTASHELGITLAAFVRGGDMNVYSHDERIRQGDD